jgi:hypothetical protein
MNPWWILMPALMLLLVAAAMRRRRSRRLMQLRTDWGRPIDRPRRLEAMAASHRGRIAALRQSRSLDDRTWTDLNLDEVFAAVDRTSGTLGQHALYHRLRTAPVADHLPAFEALVSRFTVDGAARERAQMALSSLQDPHGYDLWWLARPDAVVRRRWYGIFPVLTATTIAVAALAPFWPPAFLGLLGVLLLNVAVRYASDEHVNAIAQSFRQCAPLVAACESLRFLEGDDIDPLVAPLRTDVASLARLKLISRCSNGDPLMLSVSTQPVVIALFSDLVRAVYEYLNLALVLDGTGVYLGVRDLARGGPALVRAAAAAGEVDAAIGVASYRAGLSDWTRPEFAPAGAVTAISDVRHPLIPDAVPNSMVLRPGHGALVTGSNMSGKSTFLRTVGVNAVLAQTINTCLARDYRAPVFDIRSCIGRADDLIAGKSYYLAEVEALLDLVRASDQSPPHLFLLDELFRGTNAVERIASGQAVLQQLVGNAPGAKPHIVLAATHDSELVELTSHAFDAYHFGDALEHDGLTFDHRIQHGPATTRNAIALLALHGAPEGLLTQAIATAEMLDRQRGITLARR